MAADPEGSPGIDLHEVGSCHSDIFGHDDVSISLPVPGWFVLGIGTFSLLGRL